MALLKIRDESGKVYEIEALRGEKGADALTDLHFDPASVNAQSGVAVAEAVEGLLKRADITFGEGEPTEETGGLFYLRLD